MSQIVKSSTTKQQKKWVRRANDFVGKTRVKQLPWKRILRSQMRRQKNMRPPQMCPVPVRTYIVGTGNKGVLKIREERWEKQRRFIVMMSVKLCLEQS